jgi:hypothetical protein
VAKALLIDATHCPDILWPRTVIENSHMTWAKQQTMARPIRNNGRLALVQQCPQTSLLKNKPTSEASTQVPIHDMGQWVCYKLRVVATEKRKGVLWAAARDSSQPGNNQYHSGVFQKVIPGNGIHAVINQVSFLNRAVIFLLAIELKAHSESSQDEKATCSHYVWN